MTGVGGGGGGGGGGGAGSVVIDDEGIPPHPTAQVSALSWQPSAQSWLAVGWESGELYLYNHSKGGDDTKKCLKVDTNHAAALFLMEWSPAGSRLVTADKNGSVVGWKVDQGKRSTHKTFDRCQHCTAA